MFGAYRTALALMVVGLHLGGLVGLGSYAVYGFYALSGYLMTYVLHRTYGYSRGGFARYALNRALRIYPLYWLAIALAVLLISLAGGGCCGQFDHTMTLPQDAAAWWRNVLLFFPLLEDPRLSPATWALTVELFYYVLMGLGLSRSLRSTLIWLLAAVVYHAVVFFWQLGWQWQYFYIPSASLPFACGALLYHLRPWLAARLHRVQQGRAALFGVGVLALAFTFNWLAGVLFGGLHGLFFYSNLLIHLAIIALLMQLRSLPGCSRSRDQWLGNLSYPIYLLHYQAAVLVTLLLGGLGVLLPSGRGPVLLLASLPMVLLLSWLLSVALERPLDALRERIKA